MEMLNRAACLALLADTRIGRLAYALGGIPAVVPVLITLDGDRILFRLTTGAALAAICDRQVLVLEVDQIDLDRCEGWSINLIGLPVEVPPVLADEIGAPLCHWPGLHAGRLFRMDTDHLEGRRTSPQSPIIA